MMRGIAILHGFAVLAALAAGPLNAGHAEAKGIIADVDDHLVEITTDFSGQDILVFGAVDAPGDVVLVMRGPVGTVQVHHKARFAGIWVNAEQMRYRSAPSFYAIASSRPISELLDDRTRAIYELGLDRLQLSPASNAAPDSTDFGNSVESTVKPLASVA